MFSRLRKSPPIVLALLAMLALSGCGDSHTRVTTGTYAGEVGKAAPYLNVGPLIYEVQISRELNPYNAEEAPYLQGFTPAESRLGPGEEWFAVSLQVYNNTSHALPAATDLTITDTQGNSYTPIVPSSTNQFAYRGGLVPANNQLPEPNSVAASSPIEGALLFYKIQSASLENRPWQLKIVDPTDPSQSASAELDV